MPRTINVAQQTITLTATVTIKNLIIEKRGSQGRITLTTAADATKSVILFNSGGMHTNTASTTTAP